MLGRKLAYAITGDVFPGGCFLTSAALEYDARPGPVRDAVAAAWDRWLRLIAEEVASAQAAGGLEHDLDPGQVAFQLHAYVMAGNWAKQLFGNPAALTASSQAIDSVIGQLRPSP